MIWNRRIIAAAVAMLAGVSDAAPSSSIKPTVHSYNFDVSQFSAAPDGVTVNVLGVNKQFDVPIIVNKGDTVQITTVNNLKEATSLHWHGMFQNGSSWYDGSSMVTQCPIKPGKSFTYKFTINNQHGTYWWHSHHASQYIQGLRGPLIVHDPANEPYTKDYDSEIIVTLTDWFHEDKNTLLAQWFEVNGSGNEPVPDSALINGVGQYNCTLASTDKHGKAKGSTKKSPCADPKYTIFSVTPGKRYRFRVINMSAMSSFTFSIDGHKMDVIEADGVDTVKTTVDQVRLTTAQRYSVIVHMNQTVQNYWFRAIIDTADYMANYTTNPQVLAIVHYGNTKNVTTPTTQPSASPVSLDPYSLLPYNYAAPPVTWDIQYGVRFDINYNEQNITTAFMTVDDMYQTIPYQMPSVPSLFNVMQNKTLPNETLPIYLPRNTVVDLTIWNDDPMEHVFHLHGNRFWVMSHGAALNAGLRPGSVTQYPVRDVVSVPGCTRTPGHTGEGVCNGGLGYARIRFVTDNPGVWLLHCHMEWHMAAGLAVTLIVDAPGLQAKSNSLPASVKNTCAA